MRVAELVLKPQLDALWAKFDIRLVRNVELYSEYVK